MIVRETSPAISGKPRLVKYYSIWPDGWNVCGGPNGMGFVFFPVGMRLLRVFFTEMGGLCFVEMEKTPLFLQ